MSSRSFAIPAETRLAFILGLLLLPAFCGAEFTSPVHPFVVQEEDQQLEMIVHTGRIVRLHHDEAIPRLLVNDPAVIKVTPLSATEVRVTSLKPGVTQLTLWTPDGQAYQVDVIVYSNARELETLLQNQFPTCRLQVRPLASSVVVSGEVDRPELVNQVVQMAEDYYPKVIANITVTGFPTVLLHVRMFEISKSRLEKLDVPRESRDGVELAKQELSKSLASLESTKQTSDSDGSDPGELRYGIVADPQPIYRELKALATHELVRVLANPTLVTISGRPARFKVGGELAVPVPGGLGTPAIEYMPFGTSVDFVPIVLGNGRLRLETRPQWTEVEQLSWEAMADEGQIPQRRSIWIDTALELQSGQTLVLVGLAHDRVETVERALPWLSELPWAGPAFRRQKKQTEQVELLITVRPELVGPRERIKVQPCTHDTLKAVETDTVQIDTVQIDTVPTDVVPKDPEPTGPVPTDSELNFRSHLAPAPDKDVERATPKPSFDGWLPRQRKEPAPTAGDQ